MPTPIRWQVPIELSPEEARVAAMLHRIGKFYVFLRKVRAELFDDAFQSGVGGGRISRGARRRCPRALLAMVTVLQAYDQVGDAEAVVAAQRRSALAIGAGLSGGDRGAVLPGRAGEIPRADDRARPRSEAARSHGGAGETDRPLRLASVAGRAGFVAVGGRGPRRGYVESPGARVADRGDVRGDDAEDPARAGPGRARA